MHRRQYIPGSHVKISHAEQKALNQKLREEIRVRDEMDRQHRHAIAEEQRRLQTTGVRGFINKAKRFLTRPVFQKSA